MGMAALNWWVWSIRVGMAEKFFMHALRAHCQAPAYVKVLDTPMRPSAKLARWTS